MNVTLVARCLSSSPPLFIAKMARHLPSTAKPFNALDVLLQLILFDVPQPSHQLPVVWGYAA